MSKLKDTNLANRNDSMVRIRRRNTLLLCTVTLDILYKLTSINDAKIQAIREERYRSIYHPPLMACVFVLSGSKFADV